MIINPFPIRSTTEQTEDEITIRISLSGLFAQIQDMLRGVFSLAQIDVALNTAPGSIAHELVIHIKRMGPPPSQPFN